MKPEDLNPENNDMEVRITALLLGELTAEEAAEVQAAIARDPELTRLHDRLKAVLGLVKEAVPTTELPVGVTPEPLTLAQERREELLAVFKGGSPKAKKIIKVSFWQRYQKDLLKLAAMVVALMGVSWVMVGKREEQMAYLETTTQTDVLAGGRSFMDMMLGRSKESVKVGEDVMDAKEMANVAIMDAQASVVAAIPAGTSPYKYSSMTEHKADGSVIATITNASAALGTTASFSVYDSAAIAPDSRPQVYFSNRAAGSAEPPVNRGRVARGVTTLPSKAKAAAPAATPADVGGLRFSYADDKAVISPRAGVPAQTIVMHDSVAPMGNVQTRHYSIALPQVEGAEVAQVKELSDLSLAGGIREESRMGGGFKGGQGGGGGMGGGGAGGSNWRFQSQSQSGVANFTTPKVEVYDASSSVAGVAGRSDSFDINGGARSQQNAFGAGEKAEMPALGTTTLKRETALAALDGDRPVQEGSFFINRDEKGASRELRLNLERKSALADGSTGQRMEGEGFYRETPPAPPKPMTTTASDKVDAWRLARQESLPELRAKENAKGEALVDSGVVAGDRLARGLERNVRAESMALALPTTPALPTSQNLDAVELNFTSPTGAPAKPGSMVVSGGVALGDAQKDVWYDNSGGIAGATVADAKWTGTLQSPAAGNLPQGDRENKFVGRNANVVLPAGKSLDLNQIQDEAKNPMPANQPQVGQADGVAVITGGLRSNLGVAGSGLPPMTTDFGTRAKVVQLGKDFDADYVYTDGHNEKLAKQQVDRFGASVADGRKLSEPAPVVAMDLYATTDEAAKRMAALKSEKSPLPAAKKTSGGDAQDTKTLNELRRETEGLGAPLAPLSNDEKPTQELKTRIFKIDPKQFAANLESVSGIAAESLSNPRGGGGQGGGGGQAGGKAADSLTVPRVAIPQGGGMGGGAGISGVTTVVLSEEKQKQVRDFFAAAGVNMSSNVNGASTQVFFNDRTGVLMVRASEQDLEIIQSAVEVLNTDTPQVQVEAKFADAKQSMLPKPPVVDDELAKLSDENKPDVALQQLVEQKEELKAEVKTAVIEEDVAAKKPAPAPPAIPQPEVSTVENAFSTFSLNVSDVSFKLAAASLEKGLMPELGSVRTEEFINAFNYHDPEPTGGSRIAFAWERARYPFAHDRDLVRFSVQTAAIGREPGKPLNIVLLLDNSGSMERADRLRIRQECLRVLASQLQPQDKVSVVSFARTARLWVDGLTGAQVKELPERVGNLTPEGGTNLEAAMDLAYQTVQKHFAPQGVNRVVLLTDGAANLGEVQPESLKKKVVSYRQQGVALDCFGIGWEGYNDDLLEALSRNGDGRYGFVNSPEAATTEFAAQLSGALKVAASDVKVQVEWNPKRVTVFRQLGYAKHQLKKEEFRDNTVDAAEIGAAEAGNALYTVQVNAAGEGPLGVVRVRYRLPGTNDYREQEWPLTYDGAAKEMQQASVPLRLAGTASAFSEWLVSSPYAGEVTPEKLIAQMAGVPEAYPADPRPKQLEWMIRQAKSLSGR